VRYFKNFASQKSVGLFTNNFLLPALRTINSISVVGKIEMFFSGLSSIGESKLFTARPKMRSELRLEMACGVFVRRHFQKAIQFLMQLPFDATDI
jgi:hypothetical protein